MKRISEEKKKYGAGGFTRPRGFTCQPAITAFCVANAVIDPMARVTVGELYAAYLKWFPAFVDNKQKATRRVFTVGVQEAARAFDVIYGPMWANGKTQRGFIGLRLADNRLDDTPAGPLATARDLLTQSAARRPNDAAYVRDVRTVQDLLLTVDSMQWSRTVALSVLDEYAEIYPELDTVLALIHT